MTKEQPEMNGDAATNGTRASGRVATKKPPRESWAIYRLIESETEPGLDERISLGTLPIETDVERHIKRVYGAGRFRVEHRRNGRFVSVSEFSIQPTPREESTPDDDGDDFDEANFPPEAILPDDFDERVARIVLATLEAKERAQPARAQAQSTPDPMEQFRQMRELLKEERKEMRDEMRAMLPKSEPVQTVRNPEPQLTTEKAILHLVSQDESAISEVAGRILGSGKDQDNWSTVFKPLLNSLGQNLPHLLAIAAARSGMTTQPPTSRLASEVAMPPAQNPPQGNGATNAPVLGDAEDDEPLTIQDVLANLFEDMQEDAPVNDCAQELTTFAADNPDYATTIEGLMTPPPETVLELLNQATVNKMVGVTGMAHAPAWVGKLQAEMQRLKKPLLTPKL